MQDPFTGQATVLYGGRQPGPGVQASLQHDHQRRLEAFTRFRTAAQKVGIGTDPDDDLFLWEDDQLSLLAGADALWAELAAAAAAFRTTLPLVPLEWFGFPADHEDPMGEGSPRLHRIGSGVEASAFQSVHDGSIYKFYLPREEGRIGGTFAFVATCSADGLDRPALHAEACLGSYQDLLEKLALILALDGMPTEVLGVTPEGVVVAKQLLGERLPESTDVSSLLPTVLIPIPARFLRAHRDHPRLVFVAGKPWFIADTHAKNLVRDSEGQLRVIDLLASAFPTSLADADPLMRDWLNRVSIDPKAGLLHEANDDEL
ncbi:hypothetical protein IMCC26134_14150 [Verrucomicrobia bacterium IMCC26134]|jgi:hypothetical protein|nr:hypothetical protein IMCC26134_14150 [Verrucomicrobia bacterium IMCC26134]